VDTTSRIPERFDRREHEKASKPRTCRISDNYSRHLTRD
jgi:hypothetical protein